MKTIIQGIFLQERHIQAEIEEVEKYLKSLKERLEYIRKMQDNTNPAQDVPKGY